MTALGFTAFTSALFQRGPEAFQPETFRALVALRLLHQRLDLPHLRRKPRQHDI